MNKFYCHYLSYIDGLPVQAKSIFFNYPEAASFVYETSDRDRLKNFFKNYHINEKDLDMTVCKFTDISLKKKAEKDYASLGQIGFIDYFDENYPNKLKCIYNPPFGLYVKGRLPDISIPTVAVIGSRQPTEYGAKWAGIFTKELCDENIQIISGMARGIDGIAGRVAAGYKGLNFAVLGSGINICYPECNHLLYEELYEKGSLISEYPPDTRAEPFRFPFRNRLISGLSDAVFVAEAGIRSGSHITANFALDQGKDVFALPGPVDSPLSMGTNSLIKNGAFPALSSKDILENLKLFH